MGPYDAGDSGGHSPNKSPNKSPEKVAFIGLGVMGYPMAGHLKRAGYDVTVYNRTTSKAERWVAEFGGRAAASPREASEGSQLAFACVGADRDVREVALGEAGILAGLAPGGIFVDHTTASPRVAREVAAIASDRAQGFVDAPVSGGEAGAVNGTLTVMCGGQPEHFDRTRLAIDSYAKMCRLLGPPGAGQTTKMVNQVCIAGLLQALSEGLNLAELAGLDAAAVVEVISKGAAQSWQMDHRYQTMLAGEYDHGFAIEWMRKDLQICRDAARELGAELPVTDLVDGLYADVEAMGGRRWDTSALFARLKARRAPNRG